MTRRPTTSVHRRPRATIPKSRSLAVKRFGMTAGLPDGAKKCCVCAGTPFAQKFLLAGPDRHLTVLCPVAIIKCFDDRKCSPVVRAVAPSHSGGLGHSRSDTAR